MRVARRTADISDMQAARLTQGMLRPIVRILKRSGISDRVILAAMLAACRSYRREPVHGVAMDDTRVRALADLLMVWARDPEFIDERGMPSRLNLGKRAPCVGGLIKKARVSLSESEAVEQLCALQAIRRCAGNQQVRLISRVLISAVGKRFLIAPVLEEIRRFAETIEHNVCENPGPLNGRMQRTTLCASLDPKRLPEVQSFARQNGQAFLEALDEKLGACSSKMRSRPVEYGAGVYVFLNRRKRRLLK